jgi:hypothetical protein
VDDAWTHIARASISDDEISLVDPFQRYTYANNKTVIDDVFDLTADAQANGIAKGQRLYSNTEYQVNVTSDTVVYLVYGEENAVQNIGEIT